MSSVYQTLPHGDVFASRDAVIATIRNEHHHRGSHDRAGHYTTLFANGPEFEGLVQETHQMHRVMLEQASQITALNKVRTKSTTKSPSD